MQITTVSDFRKDIKSYLDRVTKNFETLIINRGKNSGIVVMSLQEYNSISKALSANFIHKWQVANDEDKVIYRDVGLNPPEFISQEWIAAVFTPDERKTDEQKNLLTLSDTLIEEVAQANIIVISSPMYNYGMPAVLKAWFDQVIRINKTFSFDLARGDFPIEPIMSGKKLVLITSSGEFGFEIGGIREKMNHLGQSKLICLLKL